MKVGELIKELEKFPPDLEIKCRYQDIDGHIGGEDVYRCFKNSSLHSTGILTKTNPRIEEYKSKTDFDDEVEDNIVYLCL